MIRNQISIGILATMLTGGLTGYFLRGQGSKPQEKLSSVSAAAEPKVDVAAPPEFVIDDCCVMPGLSEQEVLKALASPTK